MVLYRYNVKIAAAKGSKRSTEPKGQKAQRIFSLLLDQHFKDQQKTIASDFAAYFISMIQFELDETTYPVRYFFEGTEPDDESPVHEVTVKLDNRISLSSLADHISSSQISAFFNNGDQIQALNIIMSHFPKRDTQIANSGANSHFDTAAIKTGQNVASLDKLLFAIRGYCVSVRAATQRVLLNVQIKHAVMLYTPKTLAEYIEIFQRSQGTDLHALERTIANISINVTHIPAKTNISGRLMPRLPKTVQRLASDKDGTGSNTVKVPKFGANADQVFFSVDNKFISVAQSLKQRWNKTINEKFKDQPVVNVAPRGQTPSYLHPQFCDLVENQFSKKILSGDNTTKMLNFAVKRPAANADFIAREAQSVLGITKSANTTLEAFHLKVGKNLITVEARVLPSISGIKYARGDSARAVDGSWNLRGKQFVTPGSGPRWTHLFIQTNALPEVATDGMKEGVMQISEGLTRAMEAAGIPKSQHCQDPNTNMHFLHLARGGKSSDWATLLEKRLQTFKNNLIDKTNRNRKSFVCVVVPVQDNAIIYSTVKRIADVNVGLHTVCVRADKQSKWNDQYWANISLKINLKLGGVNQTLDPKRLGIIALSKTMVIGLDVTHPAPDSTRSAPSVAAMVASVDANLGQFPCILKLQKRGIEMVEDHVADMLTTRLEVWQKKNARQLPENIIVYRDGVSEGQYGLVIDKELKGMREACKVKYPAGKTPNFTIIICGKRHNTRFYPTDTEQTGRTGNPRPGTVVDRGVTEAGNWDFYLQAHFALQGTARPCHYYVIHDEVLSKYYSNKTILQRAGFSSTADALEDLTHSMCYLFSRATKAVSYAPPAYYADIACERGRAYLAELLGLGASDFADAHGEPTAAVRNSVNVHADLLDSMYYI